MTAGATFRLTIGAAGGVVAATSSSVGPWATAWPSARVLGERVGDLARGAGRPRLHLGLDPRRELRVRGDGVGQVASDTQVNSQSTQVTPSNGLPFSATSGPFTVLSGPQVYIGPFLGIRFGH